MVAGEMSIFMSKTNPFAAPFFHIFCHQKSNLVTPCLSELIIANLNSERNLKFRTTLRKFRKYSRNSEFFWNIIKIKFPNNKLEDFP